MPVRVGIDLVSVDAVEETLRAHGRRYLARVYTEEEVRACSATGTLDPGRIDSQRLAARFAAKEAALKVLRPADRAVPWRSIEVRKAPAGWVNLALSGPAAEIASEAGVQDLAVSLTHERGLASAVVVAQLFPRQC